MSLTATNKAGLREERSAILFVIVLSIENRIENKIKKLIDTILGEINLKFL